MQISDLPSTTNQRPAERSYLLALALLNFLAFFFGLGRLPFLGPDEPRYAEVAREMLGTGDWVTPRLGGIPWFEKPALTYWLSAAGYSLLGETELGARAGIALLATAGVFLLYAAGRRIASSETGFAMASVLATCGMWPGFARAATFDLPLSVAMELALLAFFIWDREDDSSDGWFYLFAAGLGLGLLAKGLVGIVLPGMIVLAYALLAGRWRRLLRLRLLAIGAVCCLATAAIWYGPVIARNGQPFLQEFFVGHHFQRYLTNKYRHPQPVYFFPLVLVAGSFPWSFHLLGALWDAVRRRASLRADRLRLFALLWLLIPVVFFSFSGSKLPGYILPVFPAAALLIGRDLERPRGWAAWGAGALLAGMGLAGLFLGRPELGMRDGEVMNFAAFSVLIALVYVGILFLRDARAAGRALPFCFAAMMFVMTYLLFPALATRDSIKPLALQASQQALPGERLIFFVNYDHGINFYATGLPLRDTKSELVTLFSSDEISLLASGSPSRSLLVLSHRRWVKDLTGAPKLRAEILGEQAQHVRCSPDCDWVLLRAQPK